jgi:metal-sulfur cluster biosynthetic enzyme
MTVMQQAVATEVEVRAAIASVVDPCSRLHGTDLSLIDLGMVESVAVDGGQVSVDLLLDDPLCIYTYVIQGELRDAICALPGVATVEITVLPDARWSPERVVPGARARLVGDSLARRLPLVAATARRP